MARGMGSNRAWGSLGGRVGRRKWRNWCEGATRHEGQGHVAAHGAWASRAYTGSWARVPWAEIGGAWVAGLAHT